MRDTSAVKAGRNRHLTSHTHTTNGEHAHMARTQQLRGDLTLGTAHKHECGCITRPSVWSHAVESYVSEVVRYCTQHMRAARIHTVHTLVQRTHAITAHAQALAAQRTAHALAAWHTPNADVDYTTFTTTDARTGKGIDVSHARSVIA